LAEEENIRGGGASGELESKQTPQKREATGRAAKGTAPGLVPGPWMEKMPI